MLKHIITIIKNERKQNIGLWIELLIVSVFLWYIVDNTYVTLNNHSKPLGLDTEHTYIMHLGYLNENSPRYVRDISTEEGVDNMLTALERIKQNPMIEAASISQNSSPHIGSNSSMTIFRDTLQSNNTLLRRVTPDFFKVFKYESINGSSDELVQALERGEYVISSETTQNLFKENESPIGKQLSFSNEEDADKFTVGAVSKTVRYDNFSNWNDYVAHSMSNSLLAIYANDWVVYLEYCVRVKPEEDYDFVNRFRKDMTQQLQIGNFYLSDIKYIPDNKKAYQKDDINDLKMKMYIVLFLLINIFLGVTGIFWFRTQHRRSEIGLRIAIGDTPKQILNKYFTEGLLLLGATIIPAMIAVYVLYRNELLNTYLMKFTVDRFFIGFIITYTLLAAMIVLGILIPARKAVKVAPAEALRDE